MVRQIKGSETEHVISVLHFFQLFLKDLCFLWRNNTGAYKTASGRLVRFGLKGSADLLGIWSGGILIAIEMKSARGKQTEDQILFEKHIKSLGGIYILAHDLEETIRLLIPELKKRNLPLGCISDYAE